MHPTALAAAGDDAACDASATIGGDPPAQTGTVDDPPAGARLYDFHTDPSGLPEELTDGEGRLPWRADYRAWGNTVREHWEATDLEGRPIALDAGESGEAVERNLRLQGQYLDRDTGLHYNTFRYYDPEVGRFISPNPIGLAGGFNLYGYAPNPVGWIDPCGWNATDGSGRPLSGSTYSVWTQYELPQDQFGKSRRSHFPRSNEQLYKQICISLLQRPQPFANLAM